MSWVADGSIKVPNLCWKSATRYPINCASGGLQGSPWVYGYGWCFQYLSMLMEPSTRVKSQSAEGRKSLQFRVVIWRAQNPRLHSCWSFCHTLTNITTISNDLPTMCPFLESTGCMLFNRNSTKWFYQVLRLRIPYIPKHRSGVDRKGCRSTMKKILWPGETSSHHRGAEDFFQKNLHHITQKHLGPGKTTEGAREVLFFSDPEKRLFEQVETVEIFFTIMKIW